MFLSSTTFVEIDMYFFRERQKQNSQIFLHYCKKEFQVLLTDLLIKIIKDMKHLEFQILRLFNSLFPGIVVFVVM